VDRLTGAYARSLVLALGIGGWDPEKRASQTREQVAYLVRYSHGGISWPEAVGLGMVELAQRAKAISHWIKIENQPAK
jgi:hypothetical protein